MKNFMMTLCIFTLALLSVNAFSADELMVHNAWVRSAPPSAKVLAAYMNIMNMSAENRALTGVSSRLCETVEMHKTEMHGSMMRMVPQEKLIIPAGGALTLEPGGFHLMLINPKSEVREGDRIDMELKFDDGSTLHVKMPVKAGETVGGMMEHHQH